MNIYADRLEFYGRMLVKEIIESVAKYGLGNEQQFYICFNIYCNGIIMPERVRDECLEANCLLVLRKGEYSDLKVDQRNKGFVVDLVTESGIVDHFYITFSSIVKFVDPSQDFSLEFKPVSEPQSIVISKKDPINYFTDNLLHFPQRNR